MKNELWEVNDILAYAKKEFFLPDYEKDETLKNNFGKKIRRAMYDEGMYKIVGTRKTKKNTKEPKRHYWVSEQDAKFLVNNILEEYFSNYTNKEQEKAFFDNQDAIRNKDQLEKYEQEYLPAFKETQKFFDNVTKEQVELGIYLNAAEYYSMAEDSEIILKAIIPILKELNFDIDSYLKDFSEFLNLRQEDNPAEPYGKGYSYLEHKLNHPTRYYLIKIK